MMRKSKIQLLEKQIDKAEDVVRISENLDHDFKCLKGIAVLWTAGNNNILRSSFVEGNELFPKDFELAFLQSSSNVAPTERFFLLDEKADGSKIELEFIDGVDVAKTYPYTLKIYLLLENE